MANSELFFLSRIFSTEKLPYKGFDLLNDNLQEVTDESEFVTSKVVAAEAHDVKVNASEQINKMTGEEGNLNASAVLTKEHGKNESKFLNVGDLNNTATSSGMETSTATAGGVKTVTGTTTGTETTTEKGTGTKTTVRETGTTTAAATTTKDEIGVRHPKDHKYHKDEKQEAMTTVEGDPTVAHRKGHTTATSKTP